MTIQKSKPARIDVGGQDSSRMPGPASKRQRITPTATGQQVIRGPGGKIRGSQPQRIDVGFTR